MPATLKVFCARSMTKAVEKIAADHERATGRRFDLVFATVGKLQERLAAGEAADVIVLAAPAIRAMAQAGALAAGSAADIARTSIGVAAREGTPAPDIATAEAFRAALVAARAIAVSDPAVGGSAGVYLAELFERMGLAAALAPKTMPQQTGAEVARRVAEGAADIGLTLIAEIVPIAGVRIVGKLPPPLGSTTTYAAGVSARCGDCAAAAGFIAALRDPATRALWAAAGFELP
jgi:molybdate transport system substrate-binding protein